MPYYKVVSEFFPHTFDNFVPAKHECTCNVCCKDIEAIKKLAVEAALAHSEEARLATTNAEGGTVAHEETKGAQGADRHMDSSQVAVN